jgi:hypothetical protein
MARYMIFTPAIVEGRYIEASMGNPVEIEVANALEPSRKWEPLDKEAVAALAKLDVKKGIFNPKESERQSLSHIWPSKTDGPPVPDPTRSNGFANDPEKV